MQQATELKKQLQSIHRKSYPAYKSLKGSYQFGHYILSIDHVQGDPFASPSHISVHISRKDAGFPDAYSKNNLTCISITMNWYAHASIDTAKSEVQRLIA